MADEARKTGIGILGDVPWGTHLCHFYRTKEDLIDVLVPYFKSGIENNEFCLWATSDPLVENKAREAMAKAMPDFARHVDKGQIEIAPHDQWYLKDGIFDSERVLRAWVDKLNGALAKGYSGIRASGNTSWLEKNEWPAFVDYEAAVDNFVGQHKMVVLCTYWLEKCDAGDIIKAARSHAFAFVSHNGNPELVEAALHRRTKEAEQAFKVSEEKYRLLVSSTADGIVVIQDGKLVFANPRVIEVIGHPDSRQPSSPVATLIHPDDRQMVMGCLLEVLTGGKGPGFYSFRVLDKEGKTRWVEARMVLFNWEGKPAVLALVTDITNRKHAEEKERNAQQELVVSSRLFSLGRLASGVAHEINNPLSAVIGYSQIMMEKDVPEDIKDDLQAINDNARRVAGVVKRLLAFGRQSRLGREYVDINTIVSDVIGIRAHEMSIHNIEVATKLAPDLPRTLADAGQMQQVFLNIVLNAEQAMTKAHNGGHFSVVTKRVGDSIRITFKDDGIGIAKEDLRSIFDPFFTTKAVGEGTGLGLSISYGIIREHNGRIYARGELGKGATFVVELPIVAKTDQPEPPEEPAKEPGRRVTGRILVVDDEPALCHMLTQLLTREGHSVETVDTCNAALEKLTNERFSLILLDIKMKGTNGIELYEQMAKIAPAMQRRVVFVTGDTLAARTRRFLEKTRAPYIAKPFDIQDLRERVNQMLMEGQTPE